MTKNTGIDVSRFANLELDGESPPVKPKPKPKEESRNPRPSKAARGIFPNGTVTELSREESARELRKTADISNEGFTRFEMRDGVHSKFWEIKLDGTKYITKWGRIGTSGTITVKECGSKYAAEQSYLRLMQEKLNKGYERT